MKLLLAIALAGCGGDDCVEIVPTIDQGVYGFALGISDVKPNRPRYAPGVEFIVTGDRATSWMLETDAGGGFELALEPGHYELVFNSATLPIDVAPGQLVHAALYVGLGFGWEILDDDADACY